MLLLVLHEIKLRRISVTIFNFLVYITKKLTKYSTLQYYPYLTFWVIEHKKKEMIPWTIRTEANWHQRLSSDKCRGSYS